MANEQKNGDVDFKIRFCIFMILSLLSCVVIVGMGHHDCSGDDCQICCFINFCRDFAANFLSVCCAAAVTGILFISVRSAQKYIYSCLSSNPVYVKEKLSN